MIGFKGYTRLLLTALMVCGASVSTHMMTTGSPDWTPTPGPGGMNVKALVGDGTVLLAGTAGVGNKQGGLFRSTDNGQSWTAIKDNCPVLALIKTNGTFFAGTSLGVFRSVDSGLNWTAVNSGLPDTSARALAVNGASLYVAIGSAVYRSTNNGQSWSQTNLPNSQLIGALATSGANLFVGTTGGGVLRSADNGQTWTTVNSGLPDTDIWAITMVGSTLFVGTGSKGVLRSSNDGQSWTAATSGMNAGVRAIVANGSNLYAGAFASGVYLSTDHGQSWTKINEGLLNTQIWSLAVNGGDLLAGTADGIVFRLPLTGSPKGELQPEKGTVAGEFEKGMSAHGCKRLAGSADIFECKDRAGLRACEVYRGKGLVKACRIAAGQ
jgi:photosystem II stability/assembly factor-like uncharacterized protein